MIKLFATMPYLSGQAVGLLLMAALLLLVNLGAPPIYIFDEAKAAQCAREMGQQHSLIPTFNGELYTDKPPLHFLSMMGMYALMGVSSFAARFGSVLMGLLTLLVTYRFARQTVGERLAVPALVILICSTHFLFEFRLAVTDPYLIGFNTLTLVLLYFGAATGRNRYWYGACVAAALATLAKGPVAVALPGLCFLIYALLNNQLRYLTLARIGLGTLLFAALAGPWYIWIDRVTGGEWTQAFFFTHNLSRFTAPMEGHGFLFITVPLFMAVAFLPFVLFVRWPRQFGHIQLFKGPLGYCRIIVLVYVVFFSFSSTRLPNYTMPAYPFLAILLAAFIRPYPELAAWQKAMLIVFALAIPVVAFVAMTSEPPLYGHRYYALLLAVLPLSLVLYFTKIRQDVDYTILAGIYLVFNGLFLWVVYPEVYAANPVSQSRHLFDANRPVVAYQLYNPAFNFHLPRRIATTGRASDLKAWLARHPDALVITRQQSLPEIDSLGLQIVGSGKDLFEPPTTVILTPRKSSGTLRRVSNRE